MAGDDGIRLNKRHSSRARGKSKNSGGRMEFGNLANPNFVVDLRLKKVHHDKKKDKLEEENVLTDGGKSEVTGKTITPLVRHHFPR